jgi:hypothetical protein
MNDDSCKLLETYKKKISRNIIDNIYEKYDLYDKKSHELIDKETLEKNLIFKKHKKQCIGTTKSFPISRCSRNAIDNYDYCKTHLKRYSPNKNNQSNHNSTFNLNLDEYNNEYNNEYLPDTPDTLDIQTNKLVIPTTFSKKFIEDSFYYINSNDNYIYDIKSLDKIGYIDSNNEYIFSIDPFVF